MHCNQFYSFLACCIKKYYILFKLSHDNPTVFIFERYILVLYAIMCFFPVPSFSVSVSSNASTVLDISGYNSFTVQCGGTFSPSFNQSGESLSFMLTRSSVSVTDGLSTSPVMATGDTVSQSSSVQQTASSGPATLVYNCTVEFSISGSLITTASNTTQVIVNGEP